MRVLDGRIGVRPCTTDNRLEDRFEPIHPRKVGISVVLVDVLLPEVLELRYAGLVWDPVGARVVALLEDDTLERIDDQIGGCHWTWNLRGDLVSDGYVLLLILVPD